MFSQFQSKINYLNTVASVNALKYNSNNDLRRFIKKDVIIGLLNVVLQN